MSLSCLQPVGYEIPKIVVRTTKKRTPQRMISRILNHASTSRLGTKKESLTFTEDKVQTDEDEISRHKIVLLLRVSDTQQFRGNTYNEQCGKTRGTERCQPEGKRAQ